MSDGPPAVKPIRFEGSQGQRGGSRSTNRRVIQSCTEAWAPQRLIFLYSYSMIEGNHSSILTLVSKRASLFQLIAAGRATAGLLF